MQVNTIGLHELARKLQKSLEESHFLYPYLCLHAERQLGPGAFRMVKVLMQEWEPNYDPDCSIYMRAVESEDWLLLYGGGSREGSSTIRIAFLNRLLAQPDRQLCWMPVP
jgi:hypothetical protein